MHCLGGRNKAVAGNFFANRCPVFFFGGQLVAVFLVDHGNQPLMPCSERRAKKLLESQRAGVYLQYPFALKLIGLVPMAEYAPIELRIDPGSKKTGFAIVQGNRVLHLSELEHRGHAIHKAMEARASLRRGRRGRKTRYRPARFDNRASARRKGRLPPSLDHRVLTTVSQAKKYMRLAPITSIRVESVCFDMQKMANPDIQGVEYQQGSLFGYEVRQCLLQKFDYECVYCGARDVPLEVEHVHAKSKGGTNRVTNLVISCVPCNRRKGTRTLEEFVPEKAAAIRHMLGRSLNLTDAAAVNSTRAALVRELEKLGVPVSCHSGAETKYNRTQISHLPKTHCYDAACVGPHSEPLRNVPTKFLAIRATGRGHRQMVANDKFGFPRKQAPRSRKKKREGLQTGDLVRGNFTGIARVIAARAKGSFELRSPSSPKPFSASPRSLRRVQHGNGYDYRLVEIVCDPTERSTAPTGGV